MPLLGGARLNGGPAVHFCVCDALIYACWQVMSRAGNSSSLSSTTQSISGVGLICSIAWGCQVNSGTDQ